MRLGIDLDGVVAQFHAGWMRWYNRDFGAKLEPGLVSSWNPMPHLTHFPTMGAFWTWAKGHRGGSFYRDLEAYPGALPSLEQLDHDGHQIVIVSRKPCFAVSDTFSWIGQHKLPTREVHITADKWSAGCDIFLDDSPHALVDLLAARTAEASGAIICRFVRPWNQPLPGVVDVGGWPDFVELVGRLGGRR